ncbi:hypothetical protein [Roseomonas populi]|uniref:DUF2783 domain-containing protein n=1 Tax=Roseomonas populi TaxID=3121582 RepID=A0ABT1XAA3_9PROT|nr:hypothetical protein [Roseomonas pecuniae]MCR0985010.1 hypothetical protein [Roseomonas pecuniae]
MIPQIPVTTLEAASDLLAEAIDSAGPEKEALFLAKLALALAAHLDDNAVLGTAVAAALADL